jgi:signal transduction histidine kinase
MHGEHELRRRLDASLIGGVCAGVAEYLDLHPFVVRAVVIALAVFGGIGIVVYPIGWALIPAQGTRPSSWRLRFAQARQGIAVACITGAALFLLRPFGLWLGEVVMFPLLLATSGVALILRQALAPEDVGRAPRPAGALAPWRRWPAGALGPFLVVGAALVVLREAHVFIGRGRGLIQTLVAVIAVGLLVTPYLFGLARRLTLERAQRVRIEERAETAAHLHDSVLQTLALIQRQAEDPGQVVTLARRQERELRDWLLDRENGHCDRVTLREAIERIAQEIETDHAVRVESVVVGDCPLDEQMRALVAAAREALVNAAKFAGVPRVDIYAEATPQRVELFVRDRGAGFDPEQVPRDRQGIRRSIRERMERHGGSAVVRAAPGQGTEIELSLPREVA